MTKNGTNNNEGEHLAAIDGDATLQVQESKLNQAQNGFTAEATAYDKAEGGKPPNPFEHTNNATFIEVPIGGHVRPIHLLLVESEDEVVLEDGQDLVFNSQVFVSGELKRVAGFH